MARSVIAFFMLVFLLVEPSMAQVRELDARASQQTRIISQNAVELTTSSPDLAEIRSALARQRENVVSLEAELVALRDQTQDQLSRIGEEVEGESESVSERRSALQSELDTLTEALSRTTGNLDEIDRLTFTDTVTNLANRTQFTRSGEEAVDKMRRAPGENIAVVYIDLDGFKTINESCGLTAGDQVLKHLSLFSPILG